MTARGLRNANPGNIRYVEGITSTYRGCTGSDGAFCIFDTDENGIRALCVLLLSYQDRHDIRTVRACINRWAPPSENDTGAYVDAVSKAIGCGPDDPQDFHDRRVLSRLARAIIAHENGTQPYPLELIDRAIDDALGVPGSQPAAPIGPVTAPERTDIQMTTIQPATAAPTTKGKPMDPLSLIGIVGPALQTLLPMVGTLFGGKKDAQNAQLIGTVLNTVVQAAGTAKPGEAATLASTATAIEKMQADPALTASVRTAVATHPDVAPLLEIGGGIKAAREADAAATQAARPFWYSPNLWVALFVYFLILYATIMVLGGGAGVGQDTKSMVLGFIFGTGFASLIGYYFGTTQQSGKKDETIAQVATSP